jgi:hypothetical protein
VSQWQSRTLHALVRPVSLAEEATNSKQTTATMQEINWKLESMNTKKQPARLIYPREHHFCLFCTPRALLQFKLASYCVFSTRALPLPVLKLLLLFTACSIIGEHCVCSRKFNHDEERQLRATSLSKTRINSDFHLIQLLKSNFRLLPSSGCNEIF